MEAYRQVENPIRELFYKPGNVFVDAGAHTGWWVLPMSPLFRRIIAFEPNPYSYAVLVENVKRAGLHNVEMLNMGVSNESCKKILNELDGAPSLSTVYPEFSKRQVTRKIETVFVTLDEKLRGQNEISLIKIDVEGSELDVLHGALGILKKWQPRLCVETHSEDLYHACAALLTSIGFPFETHALKGDHHKYIVHA